MDRLDLALALIQEAKQEKKRLNVMAADIAKIPVDDPDYWKKRYAIESRYSPTPHKSVVNDNLKMARRILAGEYM